MYRTTTILVVLALAACAIIPALAVNWVLDANYTTPAPKFVALQDTFGVIGDMPSWTAFTGTSIPDTRVTYHIAQGNYALGNNGLALWVGATPSPTNGLFGAMIGNWFGVQTVGLGANTSYINQYPLDFYYYTDWSYVDNGFDVDTQVVTTGGVTTVTAAVTNTTINNANHQVPYTVTATFDATSSVASWAGNTKLAALAANPIAGTGGFGITVSNIKFYQGGVQNGSIGGVVHLNGTTPGAGAMVSISGTAYTTSTGTDGSYSFPIVATGTYTMVAHLAGYADQTVTGVVVRNAQLTTQNFKLAGGRIAGTVTMAGGAPVVGATVRTADSAYTTTTATNGSYSLQMPPGTYSLVCHKSSFSDATASSVAVNDELTTTQNFAMALVLGTGQAGIVGRVTSSLTGLPIVGASVRADLSTVTTDVLGNYVLIVDTSLSPFEEFGAQATYFDAQISDLTINSGDTIVRNFALAHMTTWDLAEEFSTAFNPNGQWSYGNVNSGVMNPYPEMLVTGCANWPASAKVWTVSPPYSPAYGCWFGKNTTGSPIVIMEHVTAVDEHGIPTNIIPSTVIKDGEVTFGGQTTAYGRPSLRWTYPYSDQRFMNIHLDLENQYCCGYPQSLKIYQNNALLTSKSVSGYAGFTGSDGNGIAYTMPAVAGTPQIAYDTSLLCNPGDVIDFSYGPAYQEPNGYRPSVKIGAVIAPGTGVAVTSLGAVLARPESLTTEVALTAPVVMACELNPAGGGGFADGSFYVQSADRTVGTKCLGGADLVACNAGDRITMNGKVTHDASGQKVFLVDVITSRVAGDIPNPLGIGSKTVSASRSPRNMLVRVWGKLAARNPADIGSGPFWPTGSAQPWNYWTINDGGQDIKLPMNVQSGAMCPTWVPNDPVYDGASGWSIGQYIAVTGIETLDSTGQPVVLPLKDSSFLNYTATGR